MKIRIVLMLIALIVSLVSLKIDSKNHFVKKITLSSYSKIAEAQYEGGGPSACGVVCCDLDVMVLPPCHVRCELICVPRYFCVATGGPGILCDGSYMSCGGNCGAYCEGANCPH